MRLWHPYGVHAKFERREVLELTPAQCQALSILGREIPRSSTMMVQQTVGAGGTHLYVKMRPVRGHEDELHVSKGGSVTSLGA